MAETKCKICRRLGAKLFLKSEKCNSAECPLIRKPYAPGIKKNKGKRNISEYGKELKEKQKLKKWYNLREGQFSKYVKQVLEKGGRVANTSALLIERLESRLDNAVYRLGFANSRSQARQFVSHGHFLINGKPVDVPSYSLKKGDRISLKPNSQKKQIFVDILPSLKKYSAPAWLKLDAEKFEGEVVGKPDFVEAAPPAEVSAIFEFYSR
jgi:small subunit ribosomal protein S4